MHAHPFTAVVMAMGLACTPGTSSGIMADAGTLGPAARIHAPESAPTSPFKTSIVVPNREAPYDLEALNKLDTDGDGVPDGDDNCPNTVNVDQADKDKDGFGDVCEPKPIGVDTATTLSVSQSPARVGQPLTITLNVRNVGTATARSVVATLTTGVEFSFGSLAASQGKCSHDEWGNLRCQLGDLSVGASAAVNVVCTPRSTGSPKLEALAITDVLDRDANSGNDTPSLRLTILP
ncbi:hypothetical protein KH5H1_73480 [Corallococcus caeni]|uniref:thrombospondin type 3 repeat-containing protein n=1 Tax=Corallococcus caeni TaxID=3082388 RepID=UPI002957DA90|nr:hypothetical protein KH5H1_73480 [Corallococcus sp. KH5-1]